MNKDILKREDFIKQGSIGGKKVSSERGSEYMAEIGRKGVEAQRAKGAEYFKERARKSLEARRRNERARMEANQSPVEKLTNILTGKRSV